MVSKTNEQALEACIEKALVGTSLEERHEGVQHSSLGQGYVAGCKTDYNAHFALDKKLFFQFLSESQEATLEKFQKNNPQDWERKILEYYNKIIKKYGILHVLKKGLKIEDTFFNLMYPSPLANSSASVIKNFEYNIFSCTRQVNYSLANPLQEIDMVLFINGIPLVTLELKNPWTGQTARYHGQKQYREDRDPSQALLNFGRCVVHMAVDTDEVYMATKLAGKSTFFLPFNKGSNLGQGNPPNPYGHKTAYLWEDVFTKESLANIIQHFVRFDGKAKDSLQKKDLFFPRYHQLDVVRKLVSHATEHGAGHTYLIQHSAGSGKSNSITWAAYQLIEIVDTKAHTAYAVSPSLFDSVIVVTDRRILDTQIKNTISEFSEVKNIVAHANKSSDLKKALESGKRIIISTIQKFQYIVEGINDLSDKRFAVIIDEAHSSQSGRAHDDMNKSMGGVDLDDMEDAQDRIVQAMQARKMRHNASYFAFTATPKNITLEKFGKKMSDGSFTPFHLYSMKQAIEEGFILDVLANYTTYRSYYEIAKSIEDNPLFETKKAQKKLKNYVERSKQTIAIKSDVMLDHFVQHVVNTKKLHGKAKAMVATQSIETAIRYYQAISLLLEKQGNPFKAVIAFSGTKEVDGIEYTESEMNGFSDTATKEKFDSDEYRILVVANKYLTGFDQPKLCTMYVDKKLSSVSCVQALSRLNRSSFKLGKKTEDLFILDFFNSAEDIKTAFDPFYTATSLSKATDVNVLHELKDSLDSVAVYEWSEVEKFVEKYFNNENADALMPIIDVAVERFDNELELTHDERVDFKVKAKQFIKIYGQMAAIIPFEVLEWEKLFWFLKFLVPKLKVKDPDSDTLDSLLEAVDLSSYGLQRVRLNQGIILDSNETIVDPQNPNPRGVAETDSDKNPLDEIVSTFNEKWFKGWGATPEEQRVKFINLLNNVRNHQDYKAKYRDNADPHARELAIEKMLNEIMLKMRKEELNFYRLYAEDSAFKASLKQSIQNMLILEEC